MDKYIIQHEGPILYHVRDHWDHGTPQGTTGHHGGPREATGGQQREAAGANVVFGVAAANP
eukprot:11716691-Heterocapsa_arctica.AAC.1